MLQTLFQTLSIPILNVKQALFNILFHKIYQLFLYVKLVLVIQNHTIKMVWLIFIYQKLNNLNTLGYSFFLVIPSINLLNCEKNVSFLQFFHLYQDNLMPKSFLIIH